MKLCLVGGHLTPAIALAQVAKLHGDQVIFMGRVFGRYRALSPSHEAAAVAALGLDFYPFMAPRFGDHPWLNGLLILPLLGWHFIKALKLLHQTRPQVVVGFGSYLALPLGLAAVCLRLPLAIHEQTTVPGLVNRLLAQLAAFIGLGFAAAKPYFPPQKSVFIGNPLRPSFLTESLHRPAWLKPLNQPLLYVTGGSQGSSQLNHLVMALYPSLLKRFIMVHQTGGQSAPSLQVQSHHQKNLYRRRSLTETEVAWMMRHARLVVSRAGANTLTEIIISAKPAVLIPLPHARFAEQSHNAAVLAQAGTALVLTTDPVTPPQLLAAVNRLYQNYHTYQLAADRLSQPWPRDSAKRFYQHLTPLARPST